MRIIVCEKDPARIAFIHQHYPNVLTCTPEDCKVFTLANSDHGGADVVLEVAGAKDTFRYKLEDIEEAYHLFENKLDGVIKVAVTPN